MVGESVTADRQPIGAGFETPNRHPALTFVLFAAVVFIASGFAHLFRDTSQAAMGYLFTSTDPTEAAASRPRWVIFAVVTGVVLLVSAVGRAVDRRADPYSGVEAVGASARGEGRTISLRATMWRSAATWVASAGMVSIGRESAIIETGGAAGSIIGRRSGGRGDALATAGIAAAFAAAYHAPIAGLFYVEEHLGVRRRRRAMLFAVGGAAAGHVTSIYLFHGEAIFPATTGARWPMLWAGLILVVPAVSAPRIFLQVRTRMSAKGFTRRLGVPMPLAVTAMAAVSGAAIAWYPLAAGNGMEAIRHATVAAPLMMAMALSLGKFLATTTALGAGSPGGVLTPTISVTAGSVLLVVHAAGRYGLAPESVWDVLVVAMAIGLTVGLRSPLMATFMVPEMLGDYTLVPLIAVLVGVAWLLDQGIDRLVEAAGQRIPSGVYDEDA